jgi:hypothetical protein
MALIELVSNLFKQSANLYGYKLVIDLSFGVYKLETKQLKLCLLREDLLQNVLYELLSEERNLKEAKESLGLKRVGRGFDGSSTTRQ